MGQRMGHGLSCKASLAAAMAAAVVVAACGQSVQTQLPDLSAKSTLPPTGQQTLSSTEQKQAIDRMIAKRDAMEKEQPK